MTYLPPAKPRYNVPIIVAVGAAIVVLFCGGLTTMVALTGSAGKTPLRDQPVADSAPGSGGAAPAVGPTTPTVEVRTVTETQPVPFTETTVNDSSLAQGTRELRTAGVNGVKTLTYRVTLTGGVETDRALVSEVVTTPPVNQVVAVGTKAAPKPPAPSNCDPNYSGCVPIASDVDCAGGSGDGPAYVRGPITVIGDDIYDLDRDHDGIACE